MTPSTIQQNTPLTAPPRRAFHALTKPIGPICNLDCTYCFYLEKESLYPEQRTWKMPTPVLEEYIRQYIQQQDIPEINFAWQGGEPTLLGVDFFRQVIELQKRHADGKRINNALQTNGTLLDDEWCEFLARENFLIGLSIDGPRHLHDMYRVDKHQQPTFDAVIAGLNMLKKHHVQFNTLTVVNRHNSQRPREVYQFLKQIGSEFVQFIPLVERVSSSTSLTVRGLNLAEPPVSHETSTDSVVTPWSVAPLDYGKFLATVFDEWVRQDIGKIFLQIFEVALGHTMGLPSSLCVFAEKCGTAVAVEHNGDVYSCDHYVYPKYRLGNLTERRIDELVYSPFQQKFGHDKADTLPNYCRRCEVKSFCHGECPKHRFAITPDGEAGLNYLCAGYKHFFNHIQPYLNAMAAHLHAGRPATQIMSDLALPPNHQQHPINPNQICPCGSGMKFKRCCGKIV